MKKTISILVSIVFLLGFNFALADVVINEVMYDLDGTDTGREWIEIYNSSSTDIDIAGWKFNDGSNHNLNQPPTNGGQGSFLVPHDGYIILAGDATTFLSDHSSFSGIVIDTVMNLNNTGSTLKILDKDGNEIDSFVYVSSQGGAGDGNSLQRTSGSWISATPTPGEANQTSSSNLDLDSDSSISDETPAKTKIIETPKIKTEILAKNISFVGIPATFKANATGYSDELLSYGRYFWNFGDGDSKEIKISDFNNLQNINHTYFYPGEYNVSLEYYTNYYGNTPDAFDKMVVKVVGADIIISAVGDAKDFFVELSNNTNYDVDISNWILVSDIQRFVFPKNTILGSKKKTVFSSKITNLSIFDKDSLKLLNSQGEILFDYGSLVAKVITVKNSVKPKISPTISLLSEKTVLAREEVPISNDANLDLSIDNLPASALLSDVVKDNPLRIYIFSLVLTIFVGGSAGAVYLVRRKKVVSNIGDDFKIIDE